MTDKDNAEKTGEDIQIVFTPSGRQGNVPSGTTVLQAARTLGVDIDSVCGGRAMCGRCQIVVGEGDFAKHGIQSSKDSVTPRSKVEDRYAESVTCTKAAACLAKRSYAVMW